MKLLPGALLLGGICWLGETMVHPRMTHFDNQRIAKAWYPLLSIPTGRTKSTTFPPFRFASQPDGNLKYIIRVPEGGRCVTHELMLNTQGNPGDFASNLPSTMRFVETDYDTYFIAYIMQSHDDTFLALAGRQPTLRPGMRAKFRAVANSLGITDGILRSVLQATC